MCVCVRQIWRRREETYIPKDSVCKVAAFDGTDYSTNFFQDRFGCPFPFNAMSTPAESQYNKEKL